jgi:hypothetical protein
MKRLPISELLARYPLAVALTACFLVIFALVVVARARRSPDVRVSIGQERRVRAADEGGPRLAEPPFSKQLASLPAVQTANAIEAAQALALGLWGTAFVEADAGNVVTTYDALERAAQQRGVIPGTVQRVNAGVFKVDERQLLVRFRPKPLAVEVVVPASDTAPPLVIRIPAVANAGYFDDDPVLRAQKGTRPVAWFVGHLKTPLPPPFLNVDELVLRGWRPEAGLQREEMPESQTPKP